MNTQLLEHKFNSLPEELKQEALDFIDFLVFKTSNKKSSRNFNFRWEGGLSEYKIKYNSVDLQHKAMEWR